VAFPAFIAAPALALVGAVRYSEALDGGVRTWVYLAVLVGLLGCSVVAWLQNERDAAVASTVQPAAEPPRSF
jgi:hypothetical protein